MKPRFALMAAALTAAVMAAGGVASGEEAPQPLPAAADTAGQTQSQPTDPVPPLEKKAGESTTSQGGVEPGKKKVSQRNQPYKTNTPPREINLGVAVTLTFLPGFGAGHFYAGDTTRGITYLVVDTAVWGFGISSFILQVISAAPTYTKIALIAFPLVWAGMKAIETVDIVNTVEVENNRFMKPAGMMEYDTATKMTTVMRF